MHGGSPSPLIVPTRLMGSNLTLFQRKYKRNNYLAHFSYLPEAVCVTNNKQKAVLRLLLRKKLVVLSQHMFADI